MRPVFQTIVACSLWGISLSSIAHPALAQYYLYAPPIVVSEEGGIIEFQAYLSVTVTSLTADLTALPPGNTASFTINPDNKSGTFHWAPEPGTAGFYPVSFTATIPGLTNPVSGGTNLAISPSGTRSATLGNFFISAYELPEGFSEVTFFATDPEGTSSLPVQLSVVHYGGCDDAGGGADHPPMTRPSQRSAFAPSLVASTPVMAVWGNAEGITGWVGCASWENPINLDVLAYSAHPYLDLSFAYPSYPYFVSFIVKTMRDPQVVAPAKVNGAITVPLTINIDANDPDADPILDLTADLSGLPPGDAAFTESGDHAHGTVTWTPGVTDSGDYSVTFHAANLFEAAATTSIHIRGFDITEVPVGSAAVPRFSAIVRPNPLGPESKLEVVTTRAGSLRVRLFDLQGRLVGDLAAEPSVGLGVHELPLRLEDTLGRRLRNGVYFYRVEADEGVLVGRLTVLR